jgi:phospholipid/cholesterol/gamma-HCH transport system substrate-binding protein
MEERSLEIKVGVLVLLGLLGVVALLWLMGELRFSSGTELLVRFGHTGNVVKGAPVKLGGVRVGQVDAIELQPGFRDPSGAPAPVLMHLEVEDATVRALHTDGVAAVATQGPLGEAYLELDPGSPTQPLIQRGGTLRGKEPLRIDQVISRLGRLLNSATDSLGKNPDSIPRLIDSLGRLTAKLDEALEKNPEALSQILAELAGTMKELHGLAAETNHSFSPGGKGAALLSDAAASAKILHTELPGLTQDAKRSLHGLASITSQLTPEDGQKLKDAIAAYAEAGKHLDQIAARADKISAEIDAGQGSLGGLIKDPKLYQDVKALIAELKQHPWRILWKD